MFSLSFNLFCLCFILLLRLSDHISVLCFSFLYKFQYPSLRWASILVEIFDKELRKVIWVTFFGIYVREISVIMLGVGRGQLLGSVGRLKGMTSDSVASECVLKSYEEGGIQIISKSDPLLNIFSAHFITDTDQPQSCNFASFLPSEEDTPLQVVLSYIPISWSTQKT